MHKHRAELVLQLGVPLPYLLDLLLERLDPLLGLDDLDRDLASAPLEVSFQLVVDLGRGEPVLRGEEVLDERRESFGERAFLRAPNGSASRIGKRGRGKKRDACPPPSSSARPPSREGS